MVTTHRHFKADGSEWLVHYGGRARIRWERVRSRSSSPSPEMPAGGGGAPRTPLLPSGVPALDALANVAASAAQLLTALDGHQQQLVSDAQFEESRRLTWLNEMLAQWGHVHAGGGQLDLRVSDFLAREARELLRVATETKKMAIPQTMLYEVELISDTFRSFRELLEAQFDVLLNVSDIDVNAAIGAALPGRGINRDLLGELAQDPAAAWGERLQTKTKGGFDGHLASNFRHPEVFFERLFPSKEIAVSEPKDSAQRKSLLSRIVQGIREAMPRPESFDIEPSERADVFRELALLPAEVARVQALRSAWVATAALVEDHTGEALVIKAKPVGLAVQLQSPHARGQLVAPPEPIEV